MWHWSKWFVITEDISTKRAMNEMTEYVSLQDDITQIMANLKLPLELERKNMEDQSITFVCIFNYSVQNSINFITKNKLFQVVKLVWGLLVSSDLDYFCFYSQNPLLRHNYTLVHFQSSAIPMASNTILLTGPSASHTYRSTIVNFYVNGRMGWCPPPLLFSSKFPFAGPQAPGNIHLSWLPLPHMLMNLDRLTLGSAGSLLSNIVIFDASSFCFFNPLLFPCWGLRKRSCSLYRLYLGNVIGILGYKNQIDLNWFKDQPHIWCSINSATNVPSCGAASNQNVFLEMWTVYCRAFLVQCRLHCKLRPTAFLSERSKVAYVIACLRVSRGIGHCIARSMECCRRCWNTNCTSTQRSVSSIQLLSPSWGSLSHWITSRWTLKIKIHTSWLGNKLQM